MSDTGEPLLADFGLSLIVEDLSCLPISTAILGAGSTRWMAPELMEGSDPASKETDIWALGMTVLEVIRIFTSSYHIIDFIPDADNYDATTIF